MSRESRISLFVQRKPAGREFVIAFREIPFCTVIALAEQSSNGVFGLFLPSVCLSCHGEFVIQDDLPSLLGFEVCRHSESVGSTCRSVLDYRDFFLLGLSPRGYVTVVETSTAHKLFV